MATLSSYTVMLTFLSSQFESTFYVPSKKKKQAILDGMREHRVLKAGGD